MPKLAYAAKAAAAKERVGIRSNFKPSLNASPVLVFKGLYFWLCHRRRIRYLQINSTGGFRYSSQLHLRIRRSRLMFESQSCGAQYLILLTTMKGAWQQPFGCLELRCPNVVLLFINFVVFTKCKCYQSQSIIGFLAFPEFFCEVTNRFKRHPQGNFYFLLFLIMKFLSPLPLIYA